MFSSLRRNFGIPGVIAVVALVFAMLGGAYAASNDGQATASKHGKRHNNRGKRNHRKGQAGLNGKQKRQVKAIAKSFQGTGPAGPQGPAGANGSNGDKGDAGANGTPGANGTNGSPGANGESVTIESYTGAECEEASGEEGAKFSNGTGTAYACNGAAAGGGEYPDALPPGKSEKGTWGVTVDSAGYALSPITFNLPLAAPIPVAKVVKVASGGEGALGECSDAAETTKGTAAEPLAAPGYLCVYTTTSAGFGEPTGVGNAGDPFASEVGPTGAVITFEGAAAGEWVFGTWAVTAPTP